MGNTLGHAVFLALVLAFGLGILLTGPVQEPTGRVVKQDPATDKPYIEQLAPNDDATIFSPIQTFVFEVKNLDYNARCGLLIDGEPLDVSKTIKPEQLGTFKAETGIGYHDWRVECKLLNGRTIASPDWRYEVEPYQNMRSQNEITGMAASPIKMTDSDATGVFLIVLLLGGLVWVVNWKRAANK